MAKRRFGELPILFTIAALDVLAVGYHLVRERPVGTVITCTLLLAALAGWYAKVRNAEGERVPRTARVLVYSMTVFVLVAAFLLRRVLEAR